MADYVNQGATQAQDSSSRGKVIEGTAKIEKPKLSKRIVKWLFSDKLDSMGTYIVNSYVRPGIKGLLYSIIVGTAGVAFQQNSQPPAGNYIPGYGYQTAQRAPTPYNTLANPAAYQQPMAPGYSGRVQVYDVRFANENDAWRVINELNFCISTYGKAKTADFYRAAGVTGEEDNWTLQGTGWYNIGSAHPVIAPNGRWMIVDLPPVQSVR
jgi:hypothetical protein